MKKYGLWAGIAIILGTFTGVASLAGTLGDAVNDGDIEKVKQLIAGGENINSKDPFGRPLLHATAAHGLPDIAEFLISKGADVNGRDKDGSTALQVASFYASIKVSEVLLSKDAEINTKDKLGLTPLHATSGGCDSEDFGVAMMAVAITGNEEEINRIQGIAELLISNGADINAKDKDGNTPLHWASTQGRKSVAELLMSKGADINAKNNMNGMPLSNAAYNGHIEIVKLLVSKGTDVSAADDVGFTALHNAAAGGHKDIAEYLISNDVDINHRSRGGFFRKGKTPLGLAIDAGHKELVDFLKQHGAEK